MAQYTRVSVKTLLCDCRGRAPSLLRRTCTEVVEDATLIVYLKVSPAPVEERAYVPVLLVQHAT